MFTNMEHKVSFNTNFLKKYLPLFFLLIGVSFFLQACSSSLINADDANFLNTGDIFNPENPEAPESPGLIGYFNTTFQCSSAQIADRANTAAVYAPQGLVAYIYPLASSGDVSPIKRFGETDSKLRMDIWSELINKRKISLPDLSDLSAGEYAYKLCDFRMIDTCANARIISMVRDGSTVDDLNSDRGYVASGTFSVSAGKSVSALTTYDTTNYNINFLSPVNLYRWDSFLAENPEVPVDEGGENPVGEPDDDCDKPISPLIIDTNGDGIELSAPLNGVDFNISGRGLRRVSWPIQKDDMWLSLPKDGKIYGAQELFGNWTKTPQGNFEDNGFEVLSHYDANLDGKIDLNDRVYSQLRLWSDKNFDGKSSPEELYNLQDLGIVELKLDYTNINELDQYGNATKQRSVAMMQDGNRRMLVDIWPRDLSTLSVRN